MCLSVCAERLAAGTRTGCSFRGCTAARCFAECTQMSAFAALGSDSPRPFRNTPHASGNRGCSSMESKTPRAEAARKPTPQASEAPALDGSWAIGQQPRQPGMCGVFVKGRGLSERGTSEFRSPGRNTPRVPGGSSSPEPHHQHSLPAQHRTARKRTEQRAPNAKQNFKA